MKIEITTLATKWKSYWIAHDRTYMCTTFFDPLSINVVAYYECTIPFSPWTSFLDVCFSSSFVIIVITVGAHLASAKR